MEKVKSMNNLSKLLRRGISKQITDHRIDGVPYRVYGKLNYDKLNEVLTNEYKSECTNDSVLMFNDPDNKSWYYILKSGKYGMLVEIPYESKGRLNDLEKLLTNITDDSFYSDKYELVMFDVIDYNKVAIGLWSDIDLENPVIHGPGTRMSGASKNITLGHLTFRINRYRWYLLVEL